MADGGKIFIVLMFFILTIVMILALLFCNYYKGPAISYRTCKKNSECLITEKCDQGYCKNSTCKNSSDCLSGLVCLGGFCDTQKCNSIVGCGTGLACVNNNCIPANSMSCTGNNDCYGLVCDKAVCTQCLSISDCEIGQGCNKGVCYYPNTDVGTPDGKVFIPTSNNGKSIYPSGYYCSASDYTGPIGCSGGSPCKKGYCVAGTCRCTPGMFYETCSTGKDCASGNCLKISDKNSVCGEGPNCVFNYKAENSGTGITGASGTSSFNTCSSSSPYCVGGYCKNDVLGAYCKIDKDCAFGGTGFYYCVEGRCSANLGRVGETCGSDMDCVTYPENKIVCEPRAGSIYSVCKPTN